MKYYPLSLNLAQFKCLVVGAGKVGKRKLQTLIKFNPLHITVIDPYTVLPSNFLSYPFIQFKKKSFEEKDLNHHHIVFACTSDIELNSTIADLAKKRNLLINSATKPEQSNFILPAIIEKKHLTISISTHGIGPALAKYVKNEISKDIGPEYDLMAQILEKIRPLILKLNNSSEDNSKLLNQLVKTLVPVLKKNDFQTVAKLLKKILPTPLIPYVGEIVDELKN